MTPDPGQLPVADQGLAALVMLLGHNGIGADPELPAPCGASSFYRLPYICGLRAVDLPRFGQFGLNKVARQLNERPRKTLTFETPAERFNACVASTG
jgi:hypothetical protein